MENILKYFPWRIDRYYPVNSVKNQFEDQNKNIALSEQGINALRLIFSFVEIFIYLKK
jgi:hypothetical protein